MLQAKGTPWTRHRGTGAIQVADGENYMRPAFALFISMACVTGGAAQATRDAPPAPRYGIYLDVSSYPQDTPQKTLTSVLKAYDSRHVDYLLAQLADPQFVDTRVQKVHSGKFDDLVEETSAKLANDPGVMKKLRRFLQDGTWDVQENTATAQLKDVPERVYLKKLQGRWFLENQDRAKPQAKEK
jgi:hypothetical protein